LEKIQFAVETKPLGAVTAATRFRRAGRIATTATKQERLEKVRGRQVAAGDRSSDVVAAVVPNGYITGTGRNVAGF